MNLNILPKNVINLIMLYHSHPVADLMRTLINKYDEVCCMRCKNPYCGGFTSFFDTWRNITLDQGRIDLMIKRLQAMDRFYADF